MPPGCLLGEVCWVCLPGSGLSADPGHMGEITSLGWLGNALASHPEKLEKVVEESEIWISVLRLLTSQPGLE